MKLQQYNAIGDSCALSVEFEPAHFFARVTDDSATLMESSRQPQLSVALWHDENHAKADTGIHYYDKLVNAVNADE